MTSTDVSLTLDGIPQPDVPETTELIGDNLASSDALIPIVDAPVNDRMAVDFGVNTDVSLTTLFGPIQGTIETTDGTSTVDLLSPFGDITGSVITAENRFFSIDLETQYFGDISGIAYASDQQITVLLGVTPLGPLVGNLTPTDTGLDVDLWTLFGSITGTITPEGEQLVSDLTTPFGAISGTIDATAPLIGNFLPSGNE